MTTDVDSDIVTVGDHQLEVARFVGRRPLVLAVHGAGDDHDTHTGWVGALADQGHAAAALSLPGRRRSAGPPCVSVGEAAALVADLCATLDEDGVVLAGHSYGGGIALEVASTRPDVVSGLVLLATGGRLKVHPDILAGVRDAAARTPEAPSVDGREPNPAWVGTAGAGRTPPRTTQADWEAVNKFDRLHELARIDVPTLVIGAELDALTPPKYAHWLQAHLPHAELVMCARANHYFPVSKPHEVADHVARFVTATWG